MITGDVIEETGRFPDGHFDAVFSDPPYGFPGGFMGREWDNLGKAAKLQAWHRLWIDAVLPKLKPGGNFVAASSSSLYHRLACAAEDAGLDILPMFVHVHSEAMAQGAAIDKLIDKARNDEQRHVTALGFGDSMDAETRRLNGRKGTSGEASGDRRAMGGGWQEEPDTTAPATPAAQLWSGYSTRTKDALGPWLMARKPFDRPSYRSCVEHGTGGYAIDACRVAPDGTYPTGGVRPGVVEASPLNKSRQLGRFPSNVAFQHSEACTADACAPGCAVGALDEQSGHLKSGGMGGGRRSGRHRTYNDRAGDRGQSVHPNGDSGGASRFYMQFRYQAKSGRSERMRGLEGFFWKVDRSNHVGFVRITFPEWLAMAHLPECRKGELRHPRKQTDDSPPSRSGCDPGCKWRQRYQGNIHPTLKPIELCTYLTRLILPPPHADGSPRRLLVPFAGTGSEVIGALLAGWDEVVAIEQEPIYVEIGEARAAAWCNGEAKQVEMW